MSLLKGFKVVCDAPKFFVLNCYDLCVYVYLRLQLGILLRKQRNLKKKLGVLSPQSRRT